MTRKHTEDTVSRHLEVYASDWEFLREHFGRTSEARVGVSVAIRQMIRRGVRDYQERLQRRKERAAGAKPVDVVAVSQSLDKFFTLEEPPEGLRPQIVRGKEY